MQLRGLRLAPTTTWPTRARRRILRAVQAHRLLLVPVVALLFACGGSNPQPSAPSTTASSVEGPKLRDDQILRRDLMQTLSAGPGAFLGELEVEPVLVQGRFHGWRIVSFQNPARWAKVDLKPGDVVLKVNDHKLERPEDAMVPWQSLAIAQELRVSYERDGEPRELRYEIVDDPGTPQRPE